MHAIPGPKHPPQPKRDDCQNAPPACAPKFEPAPRTFMNEWRKLLGGLPWK
jgi:hypothetical protein